MTYSILALFVLLVHVTFVLFAVLTLPCIFLGELLNWRWVRLFWLRVLHLAGVFIVAAQAWVGVICPLTSLEMWLREQGEIATYSGSFIEHWLRIFLYWELPSWVFFFAYSLFALLVLITWFIFPPNRHKPK